MQAESVGLSHRAGILLLSLYKAQVAQLAFPACSTASTAKCKCTGLDCPQLSTLPCLQYSISEYRDRLYLEIVKRKKELRRAQKEREAARAASRSKSRSSSAYHGSSAAAGAPYGSSAAYAATAAPVRH